MIVAIIVVSVLLAGVLIAAMTPQWRRRHPPELRGDWWSQFERDFARHVAARRAYETRRSSRREPL
jgi:hypothetical protein